MRSCTTAIRSHVRRLQPVLLPRATRSAHERRWLSGMPMADSHYARAADDFYASAPFYSTAEANNARLVDLVVDGLQLTAHSRLADLGAGNGAFTDALVQRVSCGGATAVEPSREFMAGIEKLPHIRAVHASLEEWASPGRANVEASFDRVLLKEVVHHLGDSSERRVCLGAILRSGRLAPGGRLLILTRHHEQPAIPLFGAARKVWADNQPTAAELSADLGAAGFSGARSWFKPAPRAARLLPACPHPRPCGHAPTLTAPWSAVLLSGWLLSHACCFLEPPLIGGLRDFARAGAQQTEATLSYTMPLDAWCGLVRGRIWSTFSHFSDEELEEGIAEIRADAAANGGGTNVTIGDRLVLLGADAPCPSRRR